MKSTVRLIVLLLWSANAFADGTTWSSVNGAEFSPAAVADECPAGTLILSKSAGRTTLGLGPQVHFEWKSSRTLSGDGRAGECLFEHATDASASSVRRHTRVTRCEDAALEGTEDLSLTVVNAKTLVYRKTRRDAQGKPGAEVKCTLHRQK